MARLGGMSTESFSSARERLSAASTGLASILRDQKVMPGASRANVLLGLSSQSTSPAARALSNSPVRSLASSPRDSGSLLDADDCDELKEEDIWAAGMRESRSSQSLKEHLGLGNSASHGHDVWNQGCDPKLLHGFSHAHGLGPTHAHTHAHQHGHSRVLPDSPKQRMNASDGARPARPRVGDKGFSLTEAITTNAGLVRLSPLSKVSESQPPHTTARQATTLSWTIPLTERCALYDGTLHSEHQSAPVNVPNWSNVLKQKANTMSNFDGVVEMDEVDDEEWLPPHVLLAKEYARSQRMTSSVCEGQGRTLKGRDMRRVRNAVWHQTGFAD